MPIFESSGFTNIEVTMNTPGVEKIITKLCAAYPNLNVGAGTVCNMEDLDRALKAGASFIVTPIISENVIQFCVKNNIPVFPGAYTPTEIYLADRLGATAIKVFPATQLGPRYIKDVLGPLNTLKLLPTGGITTSNIKSFFEAGAFGLGMGGSLFDKEIIKNQDFEALEKHFIKITEIVKPFT
jgi:2-dehydro-3-deoxyphosphogluconate aldolase/(4S)-4-hydroxy-2-oxoglutarate aldolase